MVKRRPLRLLAHTRRFRSVDQFRERTGRAGQGAQAGLKVGHHHRGGNAFACDVGDGEKQRAVIGAAERVVVIAGNHVGGAHDESHVHAKNLWRDAGDEQALNFAGDFDVALHGDVIAENEQQQEEQATEGDDKFDLLGDEQKFKAHRSEHGEDQRGQ